MKKPTIQEFKETIDIMRQVYPFEDDKTYIVSSINMSNQSPLLELITTDEKTGVEITLERKYEQKENEELWR